MKKLLNYLLVVLLLFPAGCSKEDNGDDEPETEDPFEYLEGEWNIVQRNSTWTQGGVPGETYEDISPAEINLILDFNQDGNIYYKVPSDSRIIGGWTIDASDELFMVMTEDFEMGEDIVPDVEIVELSATDFHLILTFEWTYQDEAVTSTIEYILNREFSDFLVEDNVWEKLEVSPAIYGSRLWAAASGTKIYMGNASNSGQYDQWFASYDTEGGQVEELATNGEICACGYGSHLLNYNGELYYFANDGVKYTPLTDSWSYLNYPYDFHRGEAPCAVLDGKIYYLGGRTETTTGQYYDFVLNSWDSLTNDMDYHVHHNYATACGFNHKLYVIGGDDYGQKQVSVYDPHTGFWSRNEDAPYETGSYSTLYNNRIYITGVYGMYTYDPSDDTWGEGYAWPVANSYRRIILTVGSNLYVVGYNYSTIEIYRFNY